MTERAPRVLVIDDNPAIHDDIRKVLGPGLDATPALDALEADLFGETTAGPAYQCRVDSALQGEEGLVSLQAAVDAGDPYAVALIDGRMPPGIDGIETIARAWKICPRLQVVLCTAYSDHSWNDITHRLGRGDALLVLKKPFEPVELCQMVSTLTRKWQLQSEDREKLAQSNASLQQSLDKLRAAQDQLVQAGKLASIGQLAAGLAHELNNPLGVILGFAQGLERRLEPAAPTLFPVKSIVREALRCKGLVQELLTFARNGTRVREPTDLNELVRAAVVILKTRAVTQHVGIVQELVEGAPLFQANPLQLQQVLINLGINALDAMAPGGQLTIRTRHSAPTELQLEIEDQGTGITDEVRRHLFEPFFTTKPVGQGTGLGLSLAYETVQQHRGTIEVETELGRGTTMRVRLPVA